jgi:formylglycine-generating enzyme required for sulfatase activity
MSGTVVTVSGVPDSGDVFVGFFGDVRSTANPLEVTVSRDMTVIVRFVKRPAATMALIPSSGRTFVMGSPTDAVSQNIERPEHQVRFEYDFFMDKCEVSQGMYRNLMGANPSVVNATQGTFGVGDSFPVYYVSWYDAALFCNARSKKDGYDTVYSYAAKCKPNQTCPYVLEDLVIHYDRTGYRLPTEAEWEYACRAGTTSEYFWGGDYGTAADAQAGGHAWYEANSGNTTHPVGKTAPNGFGLFDMAGNVSEFVDDWLDAYPNSLAVNPIGPSQKTQADYEANGVRPVRGGCFELGLSFLRSGSRTEPYPMPAYTVSRHVGFRTVLGAFFADTTGQTVVRPADSLHITVQCEKSDLIALMTTASCKIVFVKDDGLRRRLCYIDFTAPSAVVRELADSLPAYGPTLSPNGSWVASSSQGIGFSGPSQVTVRRCSDSLSACLRTPSGSGAYLPTWWTDTLSPDTFIVYTTGASMDNLAVWKTEKTMLQKFSAFSFIASPVVCADTGSFPGGMSKNAEFLASGYPNAYLYDRKWNDLWRYFLPPYSGRSDTAQVCNVSLTSSFEHPDELLFLDFGYSGTSTIVKKPYGFHSELFRCNSQTQQFTHVERWYEVPEGFSEWDDVRWSNHPDFAAAVAKSEGSGSVASLFIINLKDSTYLKVATGDGVCAPFLWIDPGVLSEQPDPYSSFAKYDVAVRVYTQILITEKLKLFWTRHKGIEVGIFGSSPAMYGVDPSAMHSMKAINMSTQMGELLLSEVLSVDYFLTQVPQLKAVVMGLDPGFLDSYDPPDAPFLNGLYESEGFQFDKQHDFWRSGFPAPVAQKIAAFNSSSWPDFDSTGYLNAHLSGSWGAPVVDKGDYPFSDSSLQLNLASIKVLGDTFAARGIHLFVVEFPENPAYDSTPSIGRYGPSRVTYDSISVWLRTLEQTNSYFHFYDANNFGNHDYTDAEFLDPNHLDYLGAQKLSHRLDSLLAVYVK